MGACLARPEENTQKLSNLKKVNNNPPPQVLCKLFTLFRFYPRDGVYGTGWNPGASSALLMMQLSSSLVSRRPKVAVTCKPFLKVLHAILASRPVESPGKGLPCAQLL